MGFSQTEVPLSDSLASSLSKSGTLTGEDDDVNESMDAGESAEVDNYDDLVPDFATMTTAELSAHVEVSQCDDRPACQI